MTNNTAQKIVDLREGKAGKKPKEINVFALLLGLLAICVILTYIMPTGEYEREVVDGRSIVKPDSFHFIKADPVGFMGILGSIPAGMVDAASIMFFLLIIGGAYGVLNSTGAVEAFIVTMTRKFGSKEKLLIPVLMLFFALLGSLLGMYEETLPYILIITPLIVGLGYDALTGLGIVLVGVSAGFTTAIMNPFTVGVAQGIAGLPPFSGMGLRIAAFVVMYIVSVIFVYRHAMKVKQDPSLGEYGTIQREQIDQLLKSDITLTRKHKLILACFVLNLIILGVGVVKFGWFINEIAGMFIIFGIAIGLIARYNTNTLVDEFMKGSQALIYGAMIIGVARGIVIVLDQGHIMDTILYYASTLIKDLPPSFAAIGMMVFDSLLHIAVPSGSGMAALTMPIMSPLSDIIGVTRQTAVLIFTFGDGIFNMIIPGIAVAGAALVGVSYIRWLKWLFPLVLVQYAVAIVFVIIAYLTKYGPF